jgi:hypothetical protein
LYSDYQEKPELDKYENEGLDDDDQDELSYAERRRADVEMNKLNQRERMLKSRQPGAFNYGDFSEEDADRNGRMQRFREDRLAGDDMENELESM